MMEWFIKRLLTALEDERVRDAVVQILRESQPAPKHRPISEPIIPQPKPVKKTNTAPGAI